MNASPRLPGLQAAAIAALLSLSPGVRAASLGRGPAEGAVKFVVYGDSAGEEADRQRVVDAILAHEQGLSFALHTSIGSHESLAGRDRASSVFGAAASAEGPVGCYSTDWGNVHLVVLDAFESAPTLDRGGSISQAQLEWMKADLDAAAAAGRIIFVSLQGGARSSKSNADGTAQGGLEPVRAQIMPELAARGVAAIFAGHDRIYERSCNGGIDYLAVGGGGAPLADDAPAPAALAERAALSYTIITVDGADVTFVTKAVDGSVIGSFSLPTAGCSRAYIPGDDGGVAADAGNFPDASADGNLSVDAGPDAGNDGGHFDPGPGGGSCSQAGASLGWMALPLLAALALRRRRAA